jgi:hypothetical protein
MFIDMLKTYCPLPISNECNSTPGVFIKFRSNRSENSEVLVHLKNIESPEINISLQQFDWSISLIIVHATPSAFYMRIPQNFSYLLIPNMQICIFLHQFDWTIFEGVIVLFNSIILYV